MNEQTTQLIKDLAEKLGTTTEHLWLVLCRQAPIDATIGLIWCIVAIWLTVLAFKYVKNRNAANPDRERQLFEPPSSNNLLRVGWVLLAFFVFVSVSCELPSIAAGYFNPEYWAIKEVIRHLK